MTAVGFVGLGNIGKAMALRLVGWPGGLRVYDLDPEPLGELERAGARIGTSVADLGSHVDLVCVMVRDDDQVRQVLDELLLTCREGLTVAIHSTVAPGTPARLAAAAAAHGVRMVDAPVSGGAMGAAEGSLAIMVGGADDDFSTCAGPFGMLASKVVHAGPVGAGTRMKLARNLMHFVSFAAATEAQRLAEAAGLDLVELGRVVRHTDAITGGPGAIMHRDTTEPLATDDPWYSIFEHVWSLGEKDLSSALDLARELDVDAPLAQQALERLAPGLGLTHQVDPASDGPSQQGSNTTS